MRRHICHTPAFGSERLYGGVRIWRVTGVLSWWVCRVGGVTGCARGWRARAVGHRGATAGRPGERAAAASGLAPPARALSGRSAAFVSAPAWLTCVCQPRAPTKGAKTTCLKFHRPMRFCRGFSLSLQEALEKVRARDTTGRCCTLNSHLLSSRLSFVLAETLAFRLLECLRAASNANSRPAQGRLTSASFEPH